MNDRYNENIYQTGHTSPPKNHGGIIAVLLVLVIFLGGIASALGLMNIRLFYKLQNHEERCLSFGEGVELHRELQETSLAMQDVLPGIRFVSLSPFYQRYYGTPGGVYVNHVEEGGYFDLQGLQEGDILLSINGLTLDQTDAPETVLSQSSCPVTLTLLRSGREYTLRLEPRG